MAPTMFPPFSRSHRRSAASSVCAAASVVLAPGTAGPALVSTFQPKGCDPAAANPQSGVELAATPPCGGRDFVQQSKMRTDAGIRAGAGSLSSSSAASSNSESPRSSAFRRRDLADRGHRLLVIAVRDRFPCVGPRAHAPLEAVDPGSPQRVATAGVDLGYGGADLGFLRKLSGQTFVVVPSSSLATPASFRSSRSMLSNTFSYMSQPPPPRPAVYRPGRQRLQGRGL